MSTKTDQAAQELERVKKALKEQLDRPAYLQWVEPLELAEATNGSIKLVAENPYQVEWLEQRLGKHISQIYRGIHPDPEWDPVIEFVVADDYEPAEDEDLGNRVAKLQQAYGESKAAIINPQRVIYQTHYFFTKWRPLLGRTAADVVLAARSLCYWNPITGEERNVTTTTRDELAELAGCSPRSVDNALNNDLVVKYFVRKKIARSQTPEGPRNRGLVLQVRMDDPLTPDDQQRHKLHENMQWVVPWPQDLQWND